MVFSHIKRQKKGMNGYMMEKEEGTQQFRMVNQGLISSRRKKKIKEQ